MRFVALIAALLPTLETTTPPVVVSPLVRTAGSVATTDVAPGPSPAAETATSPAVVPETPTATPFVWTAGAVAAGGRTPEPAQSAELAAVLDLARARAAAKDWEGAASALLDHLKRASGDGALHDLLGQALEHLGRLDESAEHYDVAARLYAREGKDLPSRTASGALRRVDPLAGRRESFERKVFADLFDAAGELEAQGHPQRALEIGERLRTLAEGKDAEKLRALLEKARAAFVQVDLDQATRGRPASGEWPLVESESQHYRLACQLEPEVAERIGQVMDDVHSHYVQVYFDGDAKKAKSQKPTIRIYPTRPKMLEHWQGGQAPEGWWSPSTNEVISFDTRTTSGSLDDLLMTLFHEASHQFMTLASGGGFVPAWINEGTASFFEGTRAMADHRVLWPDAALGRLQNLVVQLKQGKPPTALDVVSYDSPGSYPGEYYSYGWGLVYFLQEYEDPHTLEHVYRPLYARYKTEIVKRGGDPLGLFDDVFLGPKSPLKHARFEDFQRDWSKWITDEVWPLFGAPDAARKLRLERVERYLAAAEAAKGDRKARVPESELLSRALGHIEYVRSRIDGDEHPDGALIVRQADVLERLARPAAAAPLIEQALDLADKGAFVLDPARYAELEKRLAKLDRRNAALRNARARTSGLVRTARALLADYRASGDKLVLRGYTFAANLGLVLDDKEGLVAAAQDLRGVARDMGRLSGTIFGLDAPVERWIKVHVTQPTQFTVAPTRVTLESVLPLSFADSDVTVHGEYEMRATLVREGAIETGSAAGFVIAARLESHWTLVGIDERGQLGLWVVEQSGKKAAVTSRVQTLALSERVAEDEHPALVVRVRADGRVTVRVGDRKPVELTLAMDPDLPRLVGVFTKNARATLTDLLVEQFP